MPLCLDKSAPRHSARRNETPLADTNYAAGYRVAVARFQRVINHPASLGNERQAIDLLANGLPADDAIFHLSSMAPVA